MQFPILNETRLGENSLGQGHGGAVSTMQQDVISWDVHVAAIL